MAPKRKRSTTTFERPKKAKQQRLPFKPATEEEDDVRLDVDANSSEHGKSDQEERETSPGGAGFGESQGEKKKEKKAKRRPKKKEASVYRFGVFKFVTSLATGQNALGEDGKPQVVCQLCPAGDVWSLLFRTWSNHIRILNYRPLPRPIQLPARTLRKRTQSPAARLPTSFGIGKAGTSTTTSHTSASPLFASKIRRMRKSRKPSSERRE